MLKQLNIASGHTGGILRGGVEVADDEWAKLHWAALARIDAPTFPVFLCDLFPFLWLLSCSCTTNYVSVNLRVSFLICFLPVY